MRKNFTTGRPKPPWKLEETERGWLKFVGDLYSGVLALVALGCGDICAAVTGCCLGCRLAAARHALPCLALKQEAYSKLQ